MIKGGNSDKKKIFFFFSRILQTAPAKCKFHNKNFTKNLFKSLPTIVIYFIILRTHYFQKTDNKRKKTQAVND